MKAPAHLAQLGTVLEVRVDADERRQTLTWPADSLWLCTDGTSQRLYLVPAPEARARKLRPSEELEAAVRAFRRWHDFEPGHATPFTFTEKKGIYRGCVRSIAYRSDKWNPGKRENYEHEFKGSPRLIQAGTLYLISGGGFSISPSGIRG